MTGKGYLRYLLGVTSFGGILYGLGGAAAMSISLPYLKASCPQFTEQMLSPLVATCMAGAMAVSPLCGPLCEWIGRKRAMLLAAVLFACGSPVLCLSGANYWVMMAGLALQGVGMGLLGMAIPLYLAECLPPESRGKGTAFFQLVLIVGLFVSGLVGLAVAYLFGAADEQTVQAASQAFAADPAGFVGEARFFSAWHTIFWCEAIPALLLFAGVLFLRDSPRWLHRRGRREEALAALAAVNGAAAAERALAEMVAADAQEAAERKANAAAPKDSLLQRKYVLPFALAVIVLACTQTCGVNSILGYSVTIFGEAGLTGTVVNWADTAFKLVMLAMTVAACVLVDRKGRTFLLKVGTGGIILSMAGAGFTFLAIGAGVCAKSPLTGWLVAGCLTVFVAAFAVGPGVCVWLALSELMPTRIRAVGMGVALLVNQLIAAGLQATLLPLRAKIGYGWLFLAFAAFTVVYFITVAFFMPETKGRTLEEIEAHFSRRGAAGAGERKGNKEVGDV